MRGRSHPRPKNLNRPIPRLCSGSAIVVRPLLIAYPWHCLSPPLNVRGGYAPVPSCRAERTEYSTPRPDGGGSRGDARSVGYYRQNSGCQGEIGLRASRRGKVKGRSPRRWPCRSSDPMREAGEPNTRKLLLRLVSWCARPTGDSYSRTTDPPAQHFNGANLRATLEVG